MALEVKRKRVDVDLILDQEKAEQVAALGADLERAMAQHVTEGGNAAAKRIAEQIDRLRDEVKDDTIRITLEALPLSQWRQVLEANTVTENGVPKQHIEDICADAVRLMVRKTVPETPVEELANVMTELSDGQISPIWYAIRDLNAKLIDPKDALESASRIIRRQYRNCESARSSASATSVGSAGNRRIGWKGTGIGASPATRRKPNGMRPNANGCSHSTNTSARCVRAAGCPSAYATTS